MSEFRIMLVTVCPADIGVLEFIAERKLFPEQILIDGNVSVLRLQSLENQKLAFLATTPEF